jgi:hypothetical protein
MFVSATAGLAQMHKVAKPQEVVRAIGVYEWTGDLAKPKASRLVPVSLYIDGGFQDAGVYVARPVPFALLTGNIYELEDSGLAKGTVELSFARHVQATNAEGDSLFEDGWLGYGVYHAPPLTATAARLRPSKTLPAIAVSGGDSSKPKLTNKSSDSADSGSAKSTDDADRPTMKRRDSGTDSSAPNSGSTSGSSGSAGSSASTAPADDPDRPTMKRKTDSDSTASNSGDSSAGKTSDDDADRPTLKRHSPQEMKKEQKEKDMPSVSGGGTALNDDPDRPNLHRGKAPGAMNADDLPAMKGIPADMHQMVAVSDAANREPHIFARPWEDDTERAVVLAKMQAFARAQLAAYKTPPGSDVMVASSTGAAAHGSTAAAQNTQSSAAAAATAEQDPGAPVLKRGIPTQAKTPVPAATAPAAAPAKTPTKTTAAKGSRTAKTQGPAQIALLDEDLRGYTLSYGGAPTFVYMAHTDGEGSALRYVTIVAQDNGIHADGAGGLGELKLALANVTDAAHLNRSPQLRLVDAVDAEASNRASLLFELRGQSSRQFALYRVIAAKPEQIFVTGSTE